MSKRDDILTVLAATHVPLTLSAIMIQAGVLSGRYYTSVVLHKLMAAGLVVREGSGLHGRPYFYALPSWYTQRGKVVPGGAHSAQAAPGREKGD